LNPKKMMTSSYLNNQFLVAMPSLADKDFSHTVTYLCQHSSEGAVGIIINRPIDMKLGDIFEQMNIEATSLASIQCPVYRGGPVQSERGFVIHDRCEQKWDSSLDISETVSLTSSRDILEAIAHGRGPENYLIALGYAGWGAGQLEKEIKDNAWLNTPYAENVLYHTPVSQRWHDAASLIGININLLTNVAGHG
jgi:putative transcriptional regulator